MGLLKDKLQTMDGKAVLLAMIEGLENPAYQVEMNTYGGVHDQVCVACAATNAITKITKVVFDADTIGQCNSRAFMVEEKFGVLSDFEDAVDYLRVGSVACYNMTVEDMGMSHLILPEPTDRLYPLTTNAYKERLQAYKDYAAQI